MIWEEITSRQNPFAVEVGKLNDRKHREKSGKFRFDGIKLAAEAVSKGAPLLAMAFRASGAEETARRVAALSGTALPEGVRMIRLADGIFDKLSEEMAPEGVICVCHAIRTRHSPVGSEVTVARRERVVLLESVRDPSNLGAIMRSAVALGVDRLILSADCADIYNAKTVRASMGTLFSLKIDRTASLCHVITAIRESGRRVFAAALDPAAYRLGDFEILPGDCVVIGNEGHGLSDAVIAACGNTVYIPMAQGAESFNAAVAAALLMWEFRK